MTIDFIEKKEYFVAEKPAGEDEIAEAEWELGISFAADYKQYTQKYGAVSFCGHEFTGVSSSKTTSVVAVTKRERAVREQLPDDFYVVEDTCFDGIVFWQDEKGKIYKTGSGSNYELVCNSLTDFFDKIL